MDKKTPCVSTLKTQGVEFYLESIRVVSDYFLG